MNSMNEPLCLEELAVGGHHPHHPHHHHHHQLHTHHSLNPHLSHHSFALTSSGGNNSSSNNNNNSSSGSNSGGGSSSLHSLAPIGSSALHVPHSTINHSAASLGAGMTMHHHHHHHHLNDSNPLPSGSEASLSSPPHGSGHHTTTAHRTLTPSDAASDRSGEFHRRKSFLFMK
ncbi:homeobox protein [Elysia marginata]|uniref:Homeobox protein n=1 Tax=Elysia marginata TaxID=1093978 RepID=A0AAV4FFC6_9GAST|nr:homeobox protein [Elysia marginata]